MACCMCSGFFSGQKGPGLVVILTEKNSSRNHTPLLIGTVFSSGYLSGQTTVKPMLCVLMIGAETAPMTPVRSVSLMLGEFELHHQD